MIFDEDDLAGAVLFFSEESDLIREMNYSEYQAILDGYVPAVDLANRELYAVYVEITSKFQVKNTVFFMVRFTSQGYIDESWSVPLFQLARFASKGPDLGGGPIGLVCASRCPIKHQRGALWDPEQKPGKSEFKAIAEAVKRNKVGIMFREQDPEKKRQEQDSADAREVMEKAVAMRLRNQYDKELADKVEQLSERHQLQTQKLIQDKELEIGEFKLQQKYRVEEYRTLVNEQKQLLADERERSAILKETIQGQAEKIQGLREYFELKLEKAEGNEQDQIEQLKYNHKIELQACVEAAVTELKEMLQMREVELQYRNEQDTKLREELGRLREQNEFMASNSGDNLLTKMLEKGVSFVTYQPGAGHITLPISDIPRYMENPASYVAQYCGVEEDHYSAWLEHFHVPICRMENGPGELCGENINRVESPADFVLGETDRCHKHRKNKTPNLKVAGSN